MDDFDICKNYSINPDFDIAKIHRILAIRNIFAHESTYVEHPENISKIDELSGNGGYTQKTPEELYSEFNNLYEEQRSMIIKFSESISKIV